VTSSAPVDADKIAGDIIERHLGQPCLAVSRARSEGNNRVYRVRTEASDFAVKFYPPQKEDPRDRLDQEYLALTFMSGHGIAAVPKPIAIDRENHCGVYEWVSGETVSDSSGAEIDAMIALASALAGLRDSAGARGLRNASASCLAATDALDQLAARYRRLEDAGRGEPALSAFLSRSLAPAVRRTLDAADDTMLQVREFEKTISPSDFGLHNALRRDDGSLVFIDFEYFGWDDAVKMVCDVLLHPGMDLPPKMQKRFFHGVEPLFDADGSGHFRSRVRLLYPVFGLIWCLILLNEFLPERWHRRQTARGGDHEQQKARQLGRATNFLRALNDDDVYAFLN